VETGLVVTPATADSLLIAGLPGPGTQAVGSARSLLSGDAFSASQRRAIEADPGSVLVLAGPGSGKTLCLISRIQFLIEKHHFDPARICAFTFTNKAAGEIADRLAATLAADAAGLISRGTIHAFCARLLREFGTHIGVQPGFGIADEDYQISLLRRVEGPRPRAWHRSALNRFSAHRFLNVPMKHEDHGLFEGYQKLLAARKVLDFDLLVIKTAELLQVPVVAETVRRRWDVILVDEFQDLNPVQYRIVRSLAHDHRHVFAVGDDEQSIYGWAGADRHVFVNFREEFGIAAPIHLEENHRCPSDVFMLARKLVNVNTPLFAEREVPRADRKSTHPITALTFTNEDEEADWLIGDIRRDRDAGLLPFLVVGTAGSTSTGAVDPLHEIADICDEQRTWLHIDAAYAGFAVLTVRGRTALAGIERAHTLTLDPHKWLFVPFECGCLLARDPQALAAAFRIAPEYLKDVESAGEEINFADYGEQLTRYSRALKVWLSVSYFGLGAIRDAIERGMDLAALAEGLLRETRDIEITSPASFGIVCFRARPHVVDDASSLDALNERVNARVNQVAGFLISSTRIAGAFSLRVCVVGYRATEADIRALVAAVDQAVRLEVHGLATA
jgi:hypothetical protein